MLNGKIYYIIIIIPHYYYSKDVDHSYCYTENNIQCNDKKNLGLLHSVPASEFNEQKARRRFIYCNQPLTITIMAAAITNIAPRFRIKTFDISL